MVGDWWAAIAVLTFAALAIVSLTGSSEPTVRTDVDRMPSILASLQPAEQSLDAIESAFASLCQEPVLVALEFVPDCETGIITLSDELFDGYGSAQLGSIAREDVAAAMTIYLSRLRRLPAIWESLEAIEIRGHTDPRAIRNPYATNMVGSQQRALDVLLFLVGPDGLADSDRVDLERLATVSGTSFSRPPTSCPERTRNCYPEWRRVEIRPVLSESLRRGDWSRTIQAVRTAAVRASSEPDPQIR
jgi:outer membrane protein OmpA-like peptidoglycan-associated protein